MVKVPGARRPCPAQPGSAASPMLAATSGNAWLTSTRRSNIRSYPPAVQTQSIPVDSRSPAERRFRTQRPRFRLLSFLCTLPTGWPKPVDSRRLTLPSGEKDPSPFRVSFHGVGSQSHVPLRVVADAVQRVRSPPSPQIFKTSRTIPSRRDQVRREGFEPYQPNDGPRRTSSCTAEVRAVGPSSHAAARHAADPHGSAPSESRPLRKVSLASTDAGALPCPG